VCHLFGLRIASQRGSASGKGLLVGFGDCRCHACPDWTRAD
ncbi:uncharacterized protein METZ01_LOCUS321513, partial [marine metagenome]